MNLKVLPIVIGIIAFGTLMAIRYEAPGIASRTLCAMAAGGILGAMIVFANRGRLR